MAFFSIILMILTMIQVYLYGYKEDKIRRYAAPLTMFNSILWIIYSLFLGSSAIGILLLNIVLFFVGAKNMANFKSKETS